VHDGAAWCPRVKMKVEAGGGGACRTSRVSSLVLNLVPLDLQLCTADILVLLNLVVV
jgi:hypothetical protein